MMCALPKPKCKRCHDTGAILVDGEVTDRYCSCTAATMLRSVIDRDPRLCEIRARIDRLLDGLLPNTHHGAQMKIFRIAGTETNFAIREHAERFTRSFAGNHKPTIVEAELLGYDADPATCASRAYAAECEAGPQLGQAEPLIDQAREAIHIGDVVELKSGGPRMTVTGWRAALRAECSWFGNSYLSSTRNTECFDVLALRKVACGSP